MGFTADGNKMFHCMHYDSFEYLLGHDAGKVFQREEIVENFIYYNHLTRQITNYVD